MFAATIAVHDLPYYLTLWGYAGIFLYFITIDQFTPVPEEISLLTIGYFSSRGAFHPLVAAAIALAAFIAVDSAYFGLIRSGSHRWKWLERRMQSRFVSTLSGRLRQHFVRTMLLLCFVPRMRMWAPMAASVAGVRYARFIRFDALFLAAFTAIYVTLGFVFHRALKRVIAEVEYLQHIIFFGVLLLVAIIIIRSLVKRNREQMREVPPASKRD